MPDQPPHYDHVHGHDPITEAVRNTPWTHAGTTTTGGTVWIAPAGTPPPAIPAAHTAALADGRVPGEPEVVASYLAVEPPADPIAAAEEQGRQAALAGESWTANPYRMAQGSPDRVKGFAWRRGFKAGEIDQADGGHFRER